MTPIFSIKPRLNFLLPLSLLVHIPQSYADKVPRSNYRKVTIVQKKRKKKRTAPYRQSIFLAGTLVTVVLMLAFAFSPTTNNPPPDPTKPTPRTNNNASNPRRKPVSLPNIDLTHAETTEPNKKLITPFQNWEGRPSVFPSFQEADKPGTKLNSKKLITKDLEASFNNDENKAKEKGKFADLRREVITRRGKKLKTNDSPKGDPKFITLDGMKLTLWVQYVNFKNWAENKDWNMFSSKHYDWWVVPVNFISRQGGRAYAVSVNEFQTLLKDENYKRLYEANIDYIFQSLDWWGIPDEKKAPGEQKDPPKKGLIGNKRWNPIDARIGKILHSLLLANDFERYRIACYFAVAKGYTDRFVKAYLIKDLKGKSK